MNDWKSLIMAYGQGIRYPWTTWLHFFYISFKNEMMHLLRTSSSLFVIRKHLSQSNKSLRDKWDGRYMEKQSNQTTSDLLRMFLGRIMGKWQKNDTWIWVGQNGVSNSNLDK